MSTADCIIEVIGLARGARIVRDVLDDLMPAIAQSTALVMMVHFVECGLAVSRTLGLTVEGGSVRAHLLPDLDRAAAEERLLFLLLLLFD